MNQEVRTLLNNAHILNNGSRELGAGVSGAAVRLGQLRGTAEADRRAISIVTTDGQQVLGAARVLQLELDQLSVGVELGYTVYFTWHVCTVAIPIERHSKASHSLNCLVAFPICIIISVWYFYSCVAIQCK